MKNRLTLTVVTAFALTAVLTGCGNDEEDCDSSGQLSNTVAMSMADARSGGSSGGRSSSGGSKSSGKGSKSKPSKPKKTKPIKIDVDNCEDDD